MTQAIDDHPHTGSMRYEEGATVPTAAVSTKGAERLAALLATGKPVRVKLELDCRWLPDAQSANVVGEIVGRERPQEIVLVGGHLDAWDLAEGAHDIFEIVFYVNVVIDDGDSNSDHVRGQGIPGTGMKLWPLLKRQTHRVARVG